MVIANPAKGLRSSAAGEGRSGVVEEFRSEFLPVVVVLYDVVWETTRTMRRQQVDFVDALRESGDHEIEMFFSSAARPKTVESIVAKLGRESTRLTQMQDIAGRRIVVPMLELQDRVTEHLLIGAAEADG
jgi:hypothetical protein